MARRISISMVVAAVLALGGAAVGRFTAPRPATPPPAVVAVTAPRPGWPGATRLVNGIPEGYAHTRAGAVAAATNDLVLDVSDLILDPARYRAVVAQLAAPEDRQRLLTIAEENVDFLQNRYQMVSDAAHGVAVVVRLVPLTYRLEAYTSQSATVDVWTLELFAVDGVLAPTDNWVTATVVLEWVGGDWKEADLGSQPGPSTRPWMAAPQTLALPTQLRTYQEYRYAAG
jgi:hypothetical protein